MARGRPEGLRYEESKAAPGVTPMEVRRVDRQCATQTIALLEELHVSLFGVQSRPLHLALVSDAMAGAIDARVALEGVSVRGVVLAAPSRYWRLALLKHWRVAVECLRARVLSAGKRRQPVSTPDGSTLPSSPRTWDEPGGAWRIIFIGTSSAARGQGVARQLYSAIMSDRSLVARIARDNVASLRLHESLGWQLYPDGDVVLAVHLHDAQGARRSA
jgi:hypothetical protein